MLRGEELDEDLDEKSNYEIARADDRPKDVAYNPDGGSTRPLRGPIRPAVGRHAGRNQLWLAHASRAHLCVASAQLL